MSIKNRNRFSLRGGAKLGKEDPVKYLRGAGFTQNACQAAGACDKRRLDRKLSRTAGRENTMEDKS
jgi:hypothetical protein